MKKAVSILLSFLLFISMTVSIFASTDVDNSVLIDNLLEDRAELIAQGKYDKLDIIDKQLEVLGVKKLTPQEVEELNKDDVVPYITKPVSNNVTWLSSRQDYTYNGTTYEIQTLIAQPNQNNSNLKIIGSRALASTYKWKAGAMNAISVLAEATYGELTGMSRVFTVYDTLNGMISGITRTTEISAAEIVYSYAHTTTASFKYIKVKGEADDKFKGFGVGADDYIIKPFLPREFMFRVMAILRRSYKDENPLVQLRDSRIDFSRAEVIKNDKHIPLTAKEYELLSALYRHAGRIVTIDALCEAAWGDNPFGYENSLMAHIRRIREKIELNPSQPVSLVTVRGLGYKLMTEGK